MKKISIGKLAQKILFGRWAKKTEVVGEKNLVRKIGEKNSKGKVMTKQIRNWMKFLKSRAALHLSEDETNRLA